MHQLKNQRLLVTGDEAVAGVVHAVGLHCDAGFAELLAVHVVFLQWIPKAPGRPGASVNLVVRRDPLLASVAGSNLIGAHPVPPGPCPVRTLLSGHSPRRR
ncbi:hypothetical protein D3C81_1732480 [compost metagenome]